MIRLLCDCGCLLERHDNFRDHVVSCPACGKGLGPNEMVGPASFSRKAVVSLGLGVAALLLTVVTAIPALIFGYRALGEISVSRGRLKGKGLARIGVILGWLGVVLLPVGLAFVAVDKVRDAALRMEVTNNMKLVGLCMQNYHDAQGYFPPPYTVADSADGASRQPGLSWRLHLIPYMESGPLYSQFKREEPWDSPTNKPLGAKPVFFFQFPNETSAAPNETHLQVFVTAENSKHHSLFDNPARVRRGVTRDQIEVGAANVIAIAESATAVPWAAPWDMTFDSNLPPPPLGTHVRAGSVIGLADATSRFLPHDTDPEMLKRLISRDGKSDIDDPDW